MVVFKQYQSTDFSTLNNVTGRVLYDSTLNALRYHDSTSYDNILLFKDGSNNLSNINNLTIGGTLGVTGTSSLNNTTDATSSTVGGSLTVAGGAGIAKKLFVGTDFAVGGNSTLTGTLGITGITTLSNTTDATSSSAGGSLTLAGGAAIAKKLFVGTDFAVGGNSTLTGTLGVTGAATLSNTLGVTGATTLSSTLGVTGATTISSTTDATSSTAGGALTISGGTAIAKQLYVGTNTFVTGNTSSSSLIITSTDTNTFDNTVFEQITTGNVSSTFGYALSYYHVSGQTLTNYAITSSGRYINTAGTETVMTINTSYLTSYPALGLTGATSFKLCTARPCILNDGNILLGIRLTASGGYYLALVRFTATTNSIDTILWTSPLTSNGTDISITSIAAKDINNIVFITNETYNSTAGIIYYTVNSTTFTQGVQYVAGFEDTNISVLGNGTVIYVSSINKYILGSNGGIAYSTNGGVSWTNTYATVSDAYIGHRRNLIYNSFNNTIVAWSYGNTDFYTSTDGVNWTNRTVSGSPNIGGCINNNNNGVIAFYSSNSSGTTTIMYTLNAFATSIQTTTATGIASLVNMQSSGVNGVSVVFSNNTALWLGWTGSTYNYYSTTNPIATVINLYKLSSSSQYLKAQAKTGHKWYTGSTTSSTGTEIMSLNTSLSITVPQTISNVTNASSSTTGALIVSGGAGIAQALYVGGLCAINSTLGVTGATTLSNTLGVTGAVTLSNTTDATSAAVGGSLTLAGGAGIAKKLFVGTDLAVGGNSTLTGTLAINSTTDASSFSSGGSLTIAGGAAVAKKLYVGTDLAVTGNTTLSGSLNLSGSLALTNTSDASSSTAGGCLTVPGGAAVAKKLYVGTNAYVTGDTSSSSLVITSTDGITFSSNCYDTMTLVSGLTGVMPALFYDSYNDIVLYKGNKYIDSSNNTGTVTESSAITTYKSANSYTDTSYRSESAICSLNDGTILYTPVFNSNSGDKAGLVLGTKTSITQVLWTGVATGYIQEIAARSSTSIVFYTSNYLMYYTTNGSTFTQNTQLSAGLLAGDQYGSNSLIWASGFNLYLLGMMTNGTSGIKYSTDGSNWLSATTPSNGNKQWIYYNSYINKAFAYQPSVGTPSLLVSSDGMTWTAVTLPTLTGVTLGEFVNNNNNGIIAIYPDGGSTNKVLIYSLDAGVTWTTKTITTAYFPGSAWQLSRNNTRVFANNTAIYNVHSTTFKVYKLDPIVAIASLYKLSSSSQYLKAQANTGYKWATGSSTASAGTDIMTLGTTLSLTVPQTITNVTDASSSTTGALIVSGGVGIAQALYVGGTCTITNATTLSSTLGVTGVTTLNNTTDASSSSAGGSLIVSGGAGIAKKLYVGTDLAVGNNSTLSGTLTVTNATTLSSTLGVNTSAPSTQAEINSATGNCLRLSYDSPTGSATNYSDMLVSSSGNLTITPSGGNVNISTHNGSTTGLKLNNTLVTATADELNYNDTTAGTGVASKAVILDSSRDYVNINYLEVDNLGAKKTNTTNNTVDYPLSLYNVPSSTPANGLGTGIEFNSVNDSDQIYTAGYFNYVSSDVTASSETGFLEFKVANAGTISSVATISNNGILSVTSLVETSDYRSKENIQDTVSNDSLEKILNVNVKTYNYKKDSDKTHHIGVIAQEIKEIIPESVVISKNDDYDDFHQVQYTALVPHLINCIKVLNEEIKELKAKLN